MISKSKDKNNNLIEFNPKGGRYRYKVNGMPKQGVTSLIGKRFSGGGLLWWAENCVYEALKAKLHFENTPIDHTQQLIDDLKSRVKTIKEEAATIGTNLHKLAEDYINGKEVVMPESEPLKTMFKKFKAYWKRSGFKVVATEKTMYSEELDVCGTSDLIVTKKAWNGKYGILDIKTSKDFYPDQVIQLHTYKKLCEDSLGYKIDYLAILNVPKEPAKEVSLLAVKINPKYLKAFRACKYIFKIEEEFKKRMIEYNKQKGDKNAK